MIPNGVYIDVETDGLYGKPWAICAHKYEDNLKIASFEFRSNHKLTDEWVISNVLPYNEDIPIIDNLLPQFAKWWIENKSNGIAFAHVSSPVESGLFRILVDLKLIDPFDGPYPLHDIASMLLIAGEDPLSVDKFLNKKNIIIKGYVHDCRYDVNAMVKTIDILFS